MNGLHEQHHAKRTSINELLNPVANGPAAAADLDDAYAPPQLAGLPSPPYAAPPHAQRVQHGVSPYSINPSGTSFSLRAASWDHAHESELARRDDGEPSSSCRYAAPAPSHAHPAHAAHQPPPHPLYAEQYQRPRPVGEHANYGIDVQPWTPVQHDHAPYGAHVLTPMYSDERTGALLAVLVALCSLCAVLTDVSCSHPRRFWPQECVLPVPARARLAISRIAPRRLPPARAIRPGRDGDGLRCQWLLPCYPWNPN